METKESTFFNFNKLKTSKVWDGELNNLFHSPNITLMRFTAKKGYTFSDKGHKSEQVILLLKGKFKINIEENSEILEEMGCAYIAPNEKHSGVALTDVEGLDIFYPKREEDKYNS